jgi:hypothetical protein
LPEVFEVGDVVMVWENPFIGESLHLGLLERRQRRLAMLHPCVVERIDHHGMLRVRYEVEGIFDKPGPVAPDRAIKQPKCGIIIHDSQFHLDPAHWYNQGTKVQVINTDGRCMFSFGAMEPSAIVAPVCVVMVQSEIHCDHKAGTFGGLFASLEQAREHYCTRDAELHSQHEENEREVWVIGAQDCAWHYVSMFMVYE